MENELSEELRSFIKQYLTSLEQLEILLWLSKRSDRAWTIEQVFKVTQSNRGSVAERLRSLAFSGFLVAEDSAASAFRFKPASPELARRVAELEQACKVSRHKVVNVIFSEPKGQAQQFADSFKLKRNK